MRRRWGLLLTACSVFLAAVNGCDRASAPVAPTSTAASAAQPPATAFAPLGEWDLTLDRDTLEGDFTLLDTRQAATQGDAFLLPLTAFLKSDTLAIRTITREAETLRVTYRVTHPFPPPTDPAAPASATNRADLGFAGVVLFLADVEDAEGQTFFEDVIVNTDLVANADAYWQPGAMLPASPGRIANCFPGLNVVDETGNGNRVGISNGGSPFGNFGTNGWTRTDLGDAPYTGWTGYGILHQGQAADRTIAFNLAAWPTDGQLSLRVALIAKYTDPRGGSTLEERLQNRLPAKPSDYRKFAYRMPHGALDVSAVRQVTPNGPVIFESGGTALLETQLLDWDAISTPTMLGLSQEPDLGRVPVGSPGAPTLELDAPNLFSQRQELSLVSVGGPWLRYEWRLDTLTTPALANGHFKALLQCTDPQFELPSPMLTVLDPSLKSIETGTGDLISFFPISVVTTGWESWAHSIHYLSSAGYDPVEVHPVELEVGPEGNSFLLGRLRAKVQVAPELNGPVVTAQSQYGDWYLTAFDPEGQVLWLGQWHDWNLLDGMELSGDGAMLYCSVQTAVGKDIDPTATVAIADFRDGMLALDAATGQLRWSAGWHTPGSFSVESISQAPNGGAALLVEFDGHELDLDPGPGEWIKRTQFDYC